MRTIRQALQTYHHSTHLLLRIEANRGNKGKVFQLEIKSTAVIMYIIYSEIPVF